MEDPVWIVDTHSGEPTPVQQQGLRHNGDQAARRTHITCSLWRGRRFATPRFGIRGSRGWAHLVASPLLSIRSPLTHMVYPLPLLSYLVDFKSISARPSDSYTMTVAALEAIALSIGKTVLRPQWRSHILCSICVLSYGALVKAVRLFIASLRSQLMGRSQVCPTDIFVDLQPLGWYWKGRSFRLPGLMG